VIKDCSEVFVPCLKIIFNPSLSQQKLPTPQKQAAVVPVFKMAAVPLLVITDLSPSLIISPSI
jgi:predicted permease